MTSWQAVGIDGKLIVIVVLLCYCITAVAICSQGDVWNFPQKLQNNYLKLATWTYGFFYALCNADTIFV